MARLLSGPAATELLFSIRDRARMKSENIDEMLIPSRRDCALAKETTSSSALSVSFVVATTFSFIRTGPRT